MARGVLDESSDKARQFVLASSCMSPLAAIRAEAAYFCTRYGDFDAAVVGNLALQFLVEFAFKLANLSASHARYVDMVAWAMAFVEMAVAAQVKKVEFVNQALAFQQVERAIHGDASDPGIHFLGAFEDFARVQMATRGFHHLQQDTALAREANAAGAELTLQPTRSFVVDALAGGYTMCWSSRHWMNRHYTKIAFEGTAYGGTGEGDGC